MSGGKRTRLHALSIAAAVAVLVLAAVYVFVPRPSAEDPVERFLAAHWADPTPPQGDPPAGFSAIEASLAPEACGTCHVEQHRDWSASLHRRAMGPGILWQLAVFPPEQANRCLRCHAPLAEQKALVARERGWPNAPATPPPAYVPEDLHRQGLVCAACHVRAHRRYGPPARRPPEPDATAHGGFEPAEAFGDSRFCATCHQFRSDGPSLNGKLLENTYEEWRMSRAAPAGQTCQSCHMPERRHLWRGIHDAGTVQAALGRELRVARMSASRARVEAKLENVGAGHRLPTYLVPKLYVTLRLIGGEGASQVLARHIIGRTANVDLTRETADTRLAQGETLSLAAEFVPGGNTAVVLEVDVAPAEHYERMFTAMLERYPDLVPSARAQLVEALDEARAKRYALPSLELRVPSKIGATARVAN